MKWINIFLLLFSMVKTEALFATAQEPDWLVIGKDTVALYSNPLEPYLDKKSERTISKHKMAMISTGNYRGYIATWLLEHDSLFLVRVNIGHDDPVYVNLSEEFGSNKVFANWVNDTIRCPQGRLLKYIHDGYASIYEKDNLYAFNQGRLTSMKNINYVEYDHTRIFPEEKQLREMIRVKIMKSFNNKDRTRLQENSSDYRLHVEFNKNGKINLVECTSCCPRLSRDINRKIIKKKVKEALRGLPKLMKVNCRWYNHPHIGMDVNVHCLKNAYDKENGQYTKECIGLY